MPARTIPCWKCGRPFTTVKPNARYCSDPCRPSNHRAKGNTTARGYGNDHMKRRKQLLPLAYGKPCPLRISPRCVGIMQPHHPLDLDHTLPIALGGKVGDRIVCAPCNRTAGNHTKRALRGLPPRRNTPQRAAPQPPAHPTSRDW